MSWEIALGILRRQKNAQTRLKQEQVYGNNMEAETTVAPHAFCYSLPIDQPDLEAYFSDVRNALSKEHTHLFCDTSFLLWLTNLSERSQAEFFAWAETINGRIHVPFIAAHEFHHHYRRGTSALNLKNACTCVEAAVKKLELHVRAIADRAAGSNGIMRSEHRNRKNELKKFIDFIQSIKSVEDQSDVFVAQWINRNTTVRTTSFNNVERLTGSGQSRFTHRMPPGFGDESKSDTETRGGNRYGDLLFWMDVLEEARLGKMRTIVILSNDRKDDWLHAPKSKPPNEPPVELKPLKVRWTPIPIPHPTLVVEAQSRAGVERLFILDKKYLGAAIWQPNEGKYARFVEIATEAEEGPVAGIPPKRPTWHRRTDKTELGLQDSQRTARRVLDGDPSTIEHELLQLLDGDPPRRDEALDKYLDINALCESDRKDKVGDLALLVRSVHDRALSGSDHASRLLNAWFGGLGEGKGWHAIALQAGIATSAFITIDGLRPYPKSVVWNEMTVEKDDPASKRVLAAIKKELEQRGIDPPFFPDSVQKKINIQILRREATLELDGIYIDEKNVHSNGVNGGMPTLRHFFGDKERATFSQILRAVQDCYLIPEGFIEFAETQSNEAEVELGARDGLLSLSDIPMIQPNIAKDIEIEDEMLDIDDGDDDLEDEDRLE